MEKRGGFWFIRHFSYLFAVDFNVSHVIFKYGRHIHLWELIFAEDNEKTSLSTGTVAYNHQLLADGRHDLTEALRSEESILKCKSQISASASLRERPKRWPGTTAILNLAEISKFALRLAAAALWPGIHQFRGRKFSPTSFRILPISLLVSRLLEAVGQFFFYSWWVCATACCGRASHGRKKEGSFYQRLFYSGSKNLATSCHSSLVFLNVEFVSAARLLPFERAK